MAPASETAKRDATRVGSHGMTVALWTRRFAERRTRLPLSQLQFRSQPLRQTFQLTLTLLLHGKYHLATQVLWSGAGGDPTANAVIARILLTVPDLLINVQSRSFI